MQVVFAILFMLLHVMMLLKMAPYIKASEDWSSFLSTLGLCLISQGALAMMVELPGEEMKTIETATTVLPCLCIAAVLGITILVDFGLNKMLCRSSKRAKQESTKVSSTTRVTPSGVDDQSEAPNPQALRAWG